MRYGKDQKQATRQRILQAAGRRFKQDGIDGAGVATLMSDAGLTNGAFYAHFASKEDLVANVLADQLRAQRQSLAAQPSDRAGLEAFIRSYLSPQHRDQCADGCPSAALLDEIARRPAATRQAFTDELTRSMDDIARRLDPTDPEAARTDALTIFGLMVGTLQLARALTDRDLSDQLLAQGVTTALALLGISRNDQRADGSARYRVRRDHRDAGERLSRCRRTPPSALGDRPWRALHGRNRDVRDRGRVRGGQPSRPTGCRASNATDFLRSHRTGRLQVLAVPIQQGRTQQLWQVEIRRPRTRN